MDRTVRGRFDRTKDLKKIHVFTLITVHLLPFCTYGSGGKVMRTYAHWVESRNFFSRHLNSSNLILSELFLATIDRGRTDGVVGLGAV